MYCKRTLIALAILALLITPVVAFGAAPRVYISAVSPDQSGYAVDEAVDINLKLKWENLAANKTIEVELWNTTDLLESLENYTIPVLDALNATIAEDGTYQVSYTPATELTETVGSKTYSLKILGADGIVIDSENFIILVATSQVNIGTTWQDTNNDRVVGVNEQVTFTVYTNWAFVENTESHSLYVDYGDGEQLLSTISITAGSGSSTATANKGFDSAGAKTVTFKLKDSTATVVKTSTVSINVGSGATTPPPASTQTSVTALITDNWQVLAIVVAIVVVGGIYFSKKHKGDDSGKKKGK